MKTKLRKLLALLMTLAMFISSVPTTALAAVVPYPGGTETGSGISLRSIVKPPVATTTYVFMNGTEEFARQILKDGQTLNNPGTPDAGSANKEFTGWRDGDNNAPTFGAVTVTETKTITYHAQFADVYFVFFTNEKGEVMVTKKGANGDTISTEGVTYPVGNEQSIVGWKDASGNLVSSVTLNGSDVTLTARVENGHWITYDSQGGTYVAPAFVKGNGTTTAPAAPTRPGYTFRHWSATVGGAAFTFGNALTTALTLYAVWTPNTRTQYTVIHWQENADDDEYSYAESETKYGTTGAQTSAAAKSYTGFTAQTIAQQTIAGDGSTIVNVYYKRNVYNVQFYERKSNRWQEIPNLKITAKYQAFIGDKWPTYNGSSTWSTTSNYSWSSGLQGPYQVNIETMPLNGAKFYGPKTGSSSESAHYYVEVLPGETGETVSGRTYKLHHTDTSPGTGYTVTVEDQYPITGFTFNSSPSTKIEEDYDNAKFYYTRNSYNIVYVSGGQTVNTASKKFEESIADAGSYTPTVKPAGMEDYDFGGWHADPAGEQAYTFTGKTMPAQNVTVYAKWNKPVYNGTIYLTIEGTTGSSITLSVPKGDTIETALNEKQAEIMAQVGGGYTWRGWRTGKDGTGEPFNPQTQITTDVTLYPYYTKDGTFKVEYDAVKNDVTAPVDGKSYAEDSFADLMSPDKLVAADGEYFLGWSDGAATYQPRDKYQIKSNHADERNVITLTAQWGARPAGTTLTYKANGGAGADVVENLANNATVTTKPADTFSRVGYTFKGWDTNPKGEGSIAPNTQVQVDNNGENVLYAIWTANTDTKYTVEFYYQNVGGTYTLNHSDKRTATTDTEVSVTAADKAAKENNKYVFEADNKNNVLSGNVAGNGSLVLKLYFKLNTASYTIHHYLNGTTVKVADDQTGAKTIGETLTANKSDALYAAYAAAVVASYAPSQTITIAADESKNVITVYYTMPLTIKAKDASKTYDGQPLTQPDFTMEGLVNGDKKENFSLSMTAASTITNAGSTPNVINTDTVKYNGGAIPSYYNVSYTNGTLTVNKASATVTITGVNETHVYDGKQHEANGYNYSFTGKPNEITISLKPNVLAIARRTDVGTTYMGLTKDSFTVTSANYDVTIKAVNDGYVTITPIETEIVITANSASKIYDGTPLTNNGFTFTEGVLVKGDVLTAVVEGSATNVGDEGKNVVKSYRVMRGDVDVTGNYTFGNSIDGKLTINKREVTLTSASDSKTYDGKPLTNGNVTIGGSGFADGEGATFNVTGTITNVGKMPNDFTYTLNEGTNANNYTITPTAGELEVTPVTDEVVVTITGHKVTTKYDGTEHAASGYDVSISNELYKEADFTFTGSAEVKGTGANTYPMGLKVSDFRNDSKNFANVKFIVTDGELVISKRPVMVYAETLEYAYDYANPMAHPADNVERYTVEAANGDRGLLAGDTLNANVLYDGQATQTLIGVYQAVAQIAAAKITNANGDVTANYTIEKVDSTLTIKGNDPIDPGKETTSVQTNYTVGDVIEYKITVKNVSRDEATNVVVTDSMAEIQDSAGYTVSEDRHTATIASIPAGGTVLVYARHTVTAEDVENAYAGDANGSLTNVANIKFGDWNKDVEGDHDELNDTYEYVVRYYWNNYTSVQPHEEKKLTARVGTEVTEKPAAIEGYTPVSADSRKLTISADQSKNVIEFYYYKNVELTANSETYTYDGAEKQVNGFTIKGENKDQADQTIAADFSAITVGAKGVDAGEYPANFAENTVGAVDKTGRYIVTAANNGKLVINPVTGQLITITANSASKTYDGTPLTDNGFDYTQGVLADGDELTAVVEGSATNVGDEGRNVVKSYVVKRGETDVTKNYTFGNSIDGKLTINKRTVTLKSETASKEYDGTPLTKPDVTVTGDGFVTGEVTDVKATGSVTFVHEGEVTNAITYTEGANFKETNYTISKDEGKLSITKREGEGKTITVTANSDEKVYDGAPLTNNGFTHAGALVEGDVLIAVVEGSQTDVGSSDNVVTSYVVMRGETDVTTSYTFGKSMIGKLTVTPVAIELTAASASKAYDGTPLTNSNYTITKGAFVDGEGLATVTIAGSQTLVGASANTITGHTLKDNTLAQNYTITYQPGELKVTQNEKAITITANSHTWEYDGQPHSDGGYTVEYDGQTYKVEAGKTATLPTGDVVKAKITKTVTNVADSAANNNQIDELTIVNAAGEDTKGQYKTVTLIPGTLTITKRGAGEDKVKITAADNTVEYDGRPHGAKLNAAGQIEVGTSYTVTNLAEGHSVKTLAIEGSETDAGVYADKLVPGNAVIVDGNGVEVTANYDITYVPGALTITRRGAGDDKVVLTAANNTVVYDGQPHGAKLNAAGEIEVGTSYTITNLADGHKVQSVVISGSETAVGEYENRLVPSGAKIVDAEGNDVTRNYVVGYKNGKLTITSPDTVIVTIRGNKDTVEYDGQKHEVNGYEVVSISNTLYTEADFGFADGATAHAEGTDAGDYFMNLTKDSFVNRNGNFSAVTFVVEDGKLTITKRGLDKENLVKIIAADNSVFYDGQPHGAKLNAAGQIEVGTSYTTEYLAAGHKVQTVAIDGSETMVGVYENRLVPNAAIIVDKNDNDVTTNYVITYVPGTLEIRKNETEIKVTANSHTWEYDGQPHTDGGYTVNYDGVDYPVAAGEFATLPTGDKVTATVEGSVTNVADSADDNNVVTNVTITNKTGTVVNDQYKTITRVNGGLKITRRGDSEDEDKKVKIIAEPNTVGYDGQSHGAKLNAAGEIELGTSYTTARLVDGHYVDETTLDITGSQTNVGVYEEELKPAVKAGATRIVIRDKDGNDVTDNYALTLVNATLTITGDKLIPDKKAEDENIESNYKLGDEIEFTITVKNVSIYDVENVIVTDANAEIQAGDGYTVSADKHTATIAIIAAKSEIRIKALHTVTSEDILAGKVGNVANVEWKDGETTVTKTVDDDTTKLTPPNVTLNVTKTSDWEGKATGAKLELGTKITYTITVKNTGNVPYTNVNFTDLLQNGDATVTGEIPTYGTLAVNEEKSFTVEYIVTEADLLKESINNKVTAEADEIEYTYYEGETEKTGKATPKGEAQVGDRTDDAKASTISTKTTTSTPANGKGYALGETITYDIVVTNDGNLTVTDIEVVDNLEGAEIKAGSGYNVVNGKAVIAELKPGESVTVKVEYVVTEADILAGKVVNDATVTGKGPGTDPEPDEPKTDDPTDEPKATLEIAKAVEGNPENGTSYALGEKITYTLTVKVGADNNVTVKDVRVTDTLLTAENVNAKIVEIAGGYTLNATGEIELPDMAPGAADVVITYTYTVQESDLGSGTYGSVHNAAVSKGATPDPDPENPNPKPDDPKDEDKKDTPTNIRLVITANNNTGIVYDGDEHGEDGYKQTGLSKDHTIEKVTISGKRTNVGEEKLVPSDAKIVDKAGNDVTSHYDIEYVNATLEIIQKKLTITADSDEKFYDETPLTKDSYTNTELAKGDKIANVTITGTITEVGSVENVASGAKIVNAAEEDVTGNYDIEYVKGTLTIKAIPADGFVDVTITKKWDDANNQDGKRDDVTLTLNASANGRLIDWDVLKDIAKNGANLTMDETAEHVFARAEFTDDKDSYSYTFRNVPKYANFNDVNTLIDFAVTENEVPDFYEIDVESSTRLMIVNVHEVKTMNIHVTKVWDDEDNNDGYRPDAITVKLYADGALYGEKTITPDENDVWETTFENLPVYKKGETISYTVEEDAIDEYTTTYSTEKPIVGGDYDEAVREVTITNRYEIKKMNIKVIKIWADSDNEDKLRPNALSFDLYKTVGGGERELVLQFQLRSSTGTSVWKYKDLRTTIGGLNVYENGEKIHYSIEETTVIEGYTVKYIDNDIVGGNKVNDQYQTDFMTWVTNYHIIKRPNRLIGPMGMTSGECVE